MQSSQLKCNAEKMEIIPFSSREANRWEDLWPSVFPAPPPPSRMVINVGAYLQGLNTTGKSLFVTFMWH